MEWVRLILLQISREFGKTGPASSFFSGLDSLFSCLLWWMPGGINIAKDVEFVGCKTGLKWRP